MALILEMSPTEGDDGIFSDQSERLTAKPRTSKTTISIASRSNHFEIEKRPFDHT